MTRLPLVVSYYTVHTPYELEVQELISSCQRFSLDHHVEGIASQGSWEKNCLFKPFFLLQKLEEFKRPLLFVDADAVFVRPLVWTEAFSHDIAVRLYNCPDDHPSRVASGALFVQDTIGAKKVLHRWATLALELLNNSERTQEIWDQEVLRRVLFQEEIEGMSWGALPPFYSVIAGHPEDEEGLVPPILIQNQASRRYKRWINHPEERLF